MSENTIILMAIQIREVTVLLFLIYLIARLFVCLAVCVEWFDRDLKSAMWLNSFRHYFGYKKIFLAERKMIVIIFS